MRVGLIGCGRWGTNIRRVLTELGHDTVVYDPALPETVPTPQELVRISDKVVVATPPQHHVEYVRMAVERQTPFFSEKPFTLNTVDAAVLRFQTRLAYVHGAAGHIALHADNYPSNVYNLRVVHTNRMPGYHNIPAWWDMGVHDVAVAVNLFGRPQSVEVVQGFDWYEARLTFSEGLAELVGHRDSGEKVWEFTVDGETWTPNSSTTEPLKNQMEWWLNGGDNLDEAVVVVETLSRA